MPNITGGINITNTGQVADGVIATADIADDAVTLGKMAAGTAGGVPVYDASGDPADVGAGSDGQFLKSNGADATPTWGDAAVIDKQTFNADGTWTKPGSGTRAFVEAWGGGGSGATHEDTAGPGAGGGAAYVSAWFELSDLGATESVTVGDGGAAVNNSPGGIAGNAGEASSFGSFLSAPGGAAGATAGAGAGGSMHASVAALAGFGGGAGGAAASPGSPSVYGGGGGGRAPTTSSGNGGAGGFSVYGGGGGGGRSGYSSGTKGAGGTSLFGGDGGAGGDNSTPAATDGSAPGGGGGSSETTSGAGGKGRVIVTVI